jgi:hypothetical protein
MGRARTSGAVRPTGFEPESEAERDRAREIVAEAERLLTRIADEAPIWLSAARAFAVNVPAGRLAEIARSPLVRAIHLSRTRR